MRLPIPRWNSEIYELVRTAKRIDEPFYEKRVQLYGTPDALHVGTKSGLLYLLDAHHFGASLRVDATCSDGTQSALYFRALHGPVSHVLPGFVKEYANVVLDERTINPAHDGDGIRKPLTALSIEALRTGPFFFDVVHLAPRAHPQPVATLLQNRYVCRHLTPTAAATIGFATQECLVRFYASSVEHLAADEVPDESASDNNLPEPWQ
jgi:hypothetical protein